MLTRLSKKAVQIVARFQGTASLQFRRCAAAVVGLRLLAMRFPAHGRQTHAFPWREVIIPQFMSLNL
jgi:hypothetical protein